MTEEQYWYGDPSLIYHYMSAFDMKQKYELQMAWTYGAYVKSALGSTQLWTVQPIKNTDWAKMPKYAENPVGEIKPTKPKTKEQLALIKKTRKVLDSLGYLEKEKV